MFCFRRRTHSLFRLFVFVLVVVVVAGVVLVAAVAEGCHYSHTVLVLVHGWVAVFSLARLWHF